MRCLIADDSLLHRSLLREMMSSVADCETVCDGDEAVRSVKLLWSERRRYDLICLDIDMPKMNGHEALLSIREFESGLERTGAIPIGAWTPIIMVTAHRDPETVFSTFRAGCEGYVPKPVSRRRLFGELKRLKVLVDEAVPVAPRFLYWLVKQNRITAGQAIQVLDQQLLSRKQFGQVATQFGFLSDQASLDIHLKKAESGMRFGEVAILLGLLSKAQVDEILVIQHNTVRSYEQLLAEMGILSADDVAEETARFQREVKTSGEMEVPSMATIMN